MIRLWQSQVIAGPSPTVPVAPLNPPGGGRMSAGEREDSDANIFADNKIVNMAEKIILLTIINRMGFFDFAALSLSLFRYTVISLLR